MKLPEIVVDKELRMTMEALKTLSESGYDGRLIVLGATLMNVHDSLESHKANARIHEDMSQLTDACLKLLQDEQNTQVDQYVMKDYKFVLQPEDNGGFSCKVEEFPGCFAQGESYPEAWARLLSAMKDWLYAALHQKLSIPPPGKKANENNDMHFTNRMSDQFVEDCTDALEQKHELEKKVDALREQVLEKGDIPRE